MKKKHTKTYKDALQKRLLKIKDRMITLYNEQKELMERGLIEDADQELFMQKHEEFNKAKSEYLEIVEKIDKAK